MTGITRDDAWRAGRYVGCPGCGAGVTAAVIGDTSGLAMFQPAEPTERIALTVVLHDSGSFLVAWPNPNEEPRWSVHICEQMRLQVIASAIDRLTDAVKARRR